MGNHYHLLIGIPVGMFSKVMHTIQSSYGSYLRRRRKWIGHVFAGRYRSLCVEKEGYLLELSRYIDQNPPEPELQRYPRSVVGAVIAFVRGKERKPGWLPMEWLLQECGATYRTAQRKYRDFVEPGIESPPPGFPGDRVVGQAVLGSNEFVRHVVERIERGEVTSKGHCVKGVDLQGLYDAVCMHYQEREIAKGCGGGRSRDMFVYLAMKHMTALNREIGQKAGGITFSAVTQRLQG